MTIQSQVQSGTGPAETPLAGAPCFIETQFPVAKISMESYKERRANYSQTLTGFGKWWGRKPLVLVRAALLGLLMPASDDPVRDREIFLKLMTMDHEGLRRRKSKTIPGKRLVAELQSMPPSIKKRFLDEDGNGVRRLSQKDRVELQELIFDRLPYAEKLQYCDRPEQIDGPSPEAWAEINAHLDTNANSLPDLVEELGRKRFGHRPRVGDAFCGGGSVPFEVARLGCDSYGSDLNPVAALLTWAALNIIGGGEDVVKSVQETQQRVFGAVDRQITEWGIEHNAQGWRADVYLYCVEVVDPETDWRVPLAPSWAIGKKTKTIARLVPDDQNKRYNIEICEGVSDEEMSIADNTGTVQGSRVVHPKGSPNGVPIEVIRQNMRIWNEKDIVPHPINVFQERLYCIRWVEKYQDENGNEQTRRHYRAPSHSDLERETKVLSLLLDRFSEWQNRGYIPHQRIEPGNETSRLQRERGWTYWHHLFNPRQLLINGLFASFIDIYAENINSIVGCTLGLGRLIDWNSRLCRWISDASKENGAQTFSNQALNTLYNYYTRSMNLLATTFFYNISSQHLSTTTLAEPADARRMNVESDIWISDPPYADSVNYHELGVFFLAWYEGQIRRLFPTWYTDSKQALAVTGTGVGFRQSMVDCYRRLAEKMPDHGLQVVMFTHQDPGVWADLTLILWAAGLRVTSAWCIQTEMDAAGIRVGNYVQGTVLLVLRKKIVAEPVFLDEITQEIEVEVRRQLDAMTELEDDSDPNFGDADYQLAAYAAALRVLTARPIYEIDPAREILRQRSSGEVGPVEALIRNAVKIACDHLVPRGFDGDLWKTLSPAERFYLKGVEVESHAEYRSGVYQELARGFGAADYGDLLANTRANETRLKSAGEFGRRMLSGAGFGGSLLRQILFAVHQAARNDETREGLNYLKTELADYWNGRNKIVHILTYLARLRHVAGMAHWHKDGEAAALLAGAVQNDHI